MLHDMFPIQDMTSGPMKEVSIVQQPIKGPNEDCKVEFIQPSNWLYSMPNLLVIQHLVTLYLGGFDVRVVSERE